MKLQELKEAGNFRAKEFQELGQRIVARQKDLQRKSIELFDTAISVNLLQTELELLRNEFDANADAFNPVELKKRAVKDSRNSLMTKNFPKVFAKRLETVLKKGFSKRDS
jgi:hypothetical protein